MRRGFFRHAIRRLTPLVCVLSLGCGGKGGGGGGGVVTPPPPPQARFVCSDFPVLKNQVALTCGANAPQNTWQIDVLIGAPTDSTDISGFAFNVLFDPTNLTYVEGSAQAGALFFQSQVDPPLVAARIDPANPGRLIVGIHTAGSDPPFGATPTYHLILRFSMKLVQGATFENEMLLFEDDQALDSSDPPQPIPSITFSDQILLSNQ